MTSYDDYFPSKYFKASDLDDGSRELTVKVMRPEKMNDGTSKLCVFFEETDKGLVLNKTNSSTLAMLSGSKNPQDAIGLRVLLIQGEGEFQGKACRTIRIRRAPTKRQAQPVPGRRGESGADLSDEIPF
jgi:hypothetical protein